MQRIASYYTESLALRSIKHFPNTFTISPPRDIIDQIEDDDGIALRLLNQTSPIPKFLHFTLNDKLLKEVEGKDRLHIIDFDIKEGLQWPSLLQSLASRLDPPTQIRITGIGDSRHVLQDTGARLKKLADSLNLEFQFHAVVDRLEDVRLWMLHVKEGDYVAVNCVSQLHKVLYDETRVALANFLGLIRSVKPSLLLVAEEEVESNDSRWEMRFASSLKYYTTLFDSISNGFMHEDCLARSKIEEMFGRRIRNVICWEGKERHERHEKFERWKEKLEDGGFRCLKFGEKDAMQSKLILRMYSNYENYRVESREGGDGLTLKWRDQDLYTVSVWAPF